MDMWRPSAAHQSPSITSAYAVPIPATVTQAAAARVGTRFILGHPIRLLRAHVPNAKSSYKSENQSGKSGSMQSCRTIVVGLFGLLMAGAASAGEPTECDRLAGSPTDPNRVGAGIGL